MKFTLNDIRRTYEKICVLSRRQISTGNEENSLRLIETAAKIAYNFNFIYTDEELEEQLQTISERLIQPEQFVPITGRVVFYDSWGRDNIGLTQQYVRAMIALDIEFLFVFEDEDPKSNNDLRLELDAYEKCEIFSVERSLPFMNRLDTLCRRIAEYRPAQMLMHITPWAVEALTVFHALPAVVKYQINLTDHAFWLGTGCLDYCLEFRSYGCTVSLEKRKLGNKQLLLNPYYPITSGRAFQGFPKEAGQQVVIFSGSSFYKVYGRDGAYFRLVKRLLDENPECILLFAGNGDVRGIRKYISENHLEKRFLLLGSRRDINEVFAHCDIYLGTYPICGGLMSQLAAENSKPILAYTTPDIACNYIEGIVCHNQSIPITFTEEKAFFAEARQLISSEEYRRQRGEELNKALTSSEQFNRNFEILLKTQTSPIRFNNVEIDYDAFADLYLEVENDYMDTFKRLLLKTFLIKTPFLFPIVFLKIIVSSFSRGLLYKTMR